mgnify:CR=1 FL=1
MSAILTLLLIRRSSVREDADVLSMLMKSGDSTAVIFLLCSYLFFGTKCNWGFQDCLVLVIDWIISLS